MLNISEVPFTCWPSQFPNRMVLCGLCEPGQQDLVPLLHGSLLLLHTILHHSECFLSGIVPSATWGNVSITYDLIHLLMMFGQSKAHLRPIKAFFLLTVTIFFAWQVTCVCVSVCSHIFYILGTKIFWNSFLRLNFKWEEGLRRGFKGQSLLG